MAATLSSVSDAFALLYMILAFALVAACAAGYKPSDRVIGVVLGTILSVLAHTRLDLRERLPAGHCAQESR